MQKNHNAKCIMFSKISDFFFFFLVKGHKKSDKLKNKTKQNTPQKTVEGTV